MKSTDIKAFIFHNPEGVEQWNSSKNSTLSGLLNRFAFPPVLPAAIQIKAFQALKAISHFAKQLAFNVFT